MDFSQFKSREQVNSFFLKMDESHLWPINGRFNATEVAIERLKNLENDMGKLDVVEYAHALDYEISNIVNDPKLL